MDKTTDSLYIHLLNELEIKDFAQQHDLQGLGSEEDPIIFSKSFDQPITISNSNLFIIFKDCNLVSLSLRRTRNILFQDVELRVLRLYRSSLIQINTNKINKFVLRKSSQVEVEGCKIERFEIVRSFENTFRECKFNFVENFYSRGNIFEKCEFEIVDMKNLINARLSRVYLILIALLPMFLTGIFYAYFSNNIIYFIMMCIIIPFTYIMILTVFLAGYKEAKKYEPNKIL